MYILLVDHQTLFRAGIEEIFLNNSTSHVVKGCSSIDTMNRHLRSSPIDLVLLEVGIVSSNGIDDIIDIRKNFPKVKIAVLSAELDPIVIHRAIDNGASGYITKSSSMAKLFETIDMIFAGEICLPIEYTATRSRIVNSSTVQRSSTSIMTSLSIRQREVLTLLLQGKPNKTISYLLNISNNTVKTHMSAIFRTLGANNRTEAVYYAAKAGVPFDLTETQSSFEIESSRIAS